MRAFIFILVLSIISSGAFASADKNKAAVKNKLETKPAITEKVTLPPPTIITGTDLPLCPQLKEASTYRGGNKILRFLRHGKNGWLFRTFDFRQDFSLSKQGHNDFDRLYNALKEREISLTVVLQPPRAVVGKDYLDPTDIEAGYDPEVARKGYKKFLNELNEIGISTVDLEKIPKEINYFNLRDPHWTYEGAKYTAAKTAEVVKNFDAYKSIPKKVYSTEIIGEQENDKGEFQEFVEKVCNLQAPPTPRHLYATTEAGDQISENSLLGDNAPQIAVIGTSNSAHEDVFSYVGSLKVDLEADIYNAAVEAGAFDGASVIYYASDEFQNTPPKIIIWEFLSHHIFEEPLSFRQMIPAIKGACSEDKALMKSEIEITDTETTIFDNMEKIKINDGKHFMYLEVTAPEERNLQIGVLYKNGDIDSADITRSRRTSNNGKYYLEFNPDIDQPPLLVQVLTDKPIGHIKARLCKYD